MSMKECPSCGILVPESASRCKDCFHDFTEAPPKRGFMGGILLLLGTIAAMAVVGAGTLWWVASAPMEEKILVDGESQSVVWTRKYRNSIETDRLSFSEISKIQYVIKSRGGFEVVAVTHAGDRKVISENPSPIKSTAAQYAQLMNKPLEEVDNTRGFGK